MRVKEIAIYGAGGFGREVACVINKINSIKKTWEIAGFFDDGVKKGVQVSHFGKVLGDINDLNKRKKNLDVVFAIGNPKTIKYLFEKINNPEIKFPNLIHPDSFFSDEITFKIGKGNVITRGCSISCDVSIGDFNQLNSLTAFGHDVKINSFNVFMPLVRVSGGCTVGNCNFFGIGTVILQRVRIGNNTRLGAGSVVIKKTQDGLLYMGNPAKKIHL